MMLDACTMTQFMWQADMHGVAKLVTECQSVNYSTDLDGVRHSITPRCTTWLEEM